MSPTGERGFTIVEVVVAVLVLSIGVTALVGTSALATRQIGRGRVVTIANQVATQRLEFLRREARRVPGSPCTTAGTAFSNGSATTRGITESWTIQTVGALGNARTVRVTVQYPRVGGTSSFTLSTIVGCY
jgi:prepilin-type N-terminal cleavage/methylation domain-containing protein